MSERWRQHVYDATLRKVAVPLHAAIRKHGAGSFDVVELFVYPTRSEACHAERELVHHLRSVPPGLYNASEGGDGGNTRQGLKHRPETIEKMRRAAVGRRPPITPESVAKVAAANRGRHRSAETRAEISRGRRGKKWAAPMTAEAREKIAASLRNRVKSAQHLENLSRGIKAAWADPEKRAARIARNRARRAMKIIFRASLASENPNTEN